MKYAVLDATTKTYTYYVYDRHNLLRAVIPPKAVKQIDDLATEPETLAIANTIISELCYIYNYDHRNRMTEKKLPGADWVYMVYDKRDRLVATQDGNQRDVSTVYDEWTFTRYDALNRPILTGIYKWDKGRTRADLQSAANSYTGTNLYEETGGNIHGYTNHSFPGARYNNTGPIDENDVLTVTYYDNYSNTSYTYANPNRSQLDAELIGFETTNSSNVKGMAAITKTKVLNPTTGMTNTWLEEVVFYDKKSRPIQTITENAWGGYDRISTKYSFAGQVLATIQEHKRTTGSSSEYIAKLFSYDHAGRLLTTQQLIEGDATNGKVTTASYMYDELGQLTTKSIHNRVQNVDYNYNIRGWLTGINNPYNMGSDLFAMNLGYKKDMEGNATPQYNGNISHAIWRYAGNILAGCYAYEYDRLNRLILASHLDYTDANGFVADNEYDVEGIMYDLNGNIENLTRYADNGDGKIDDLSYNYFGNKLIGVEDVALSGKGGFEEFSSEGDGSDAANQNTWEYSYDNNGNMIADKNKNIQLNYNYLKLPKIIESDGNSDEIEYIYTANGIKIAKKVYQGGATNTRYYIGNREYNGTTPDIMHFNEGYIDLATNTYHYYLNDHLGNTRIVFKMNGGDAQVVQKNDYYPFGMDMYSWHSGTENKYKYNGKELQDESLGGVQLDWYDYHARMYDPTLGRWHTQDPLSEKYYRWSPYNYAIGNPITFLDPNGMEVFHSQYLRNTLGTHWSDQIGDNEDGDKDEEDENNDTGKQKKKKNKKIPPPIDKDGLLVIKRKLRKMSNNEIKDEITDNHKNDDEYENGTIIEFLIKYKNKTYDEIINESKNKSSTKLNSQLGGPELRYIKDPLSDAYIDMRHFLIIGKKGETFGYLVEDLQYIGGMKGSAYNLQDYFSNHMGSEFFKKYNYLIQQNPDKVSMYIHSFMNSNDFKHIREIYKAPGIN